MVIYKYLQTKMFSVEAENVKDVLFPESSDLSIFWQTILALLIWK